MNTYDYEEIDLLIIRCLEQVAPAEEKEMLESWLKTSPTNSAYFSQIKNIWEASGRKFTPASISTERALQKVIANISANERRSFWQYWQKAAAILIIPLLVGGYWWGRRASDKSDSNPVSYNEVFAAYGTRSALKLADGSKVWLNSGSSLRYPDRFTEKSRNVYLNGEAYFEVQSDTEHPFVVETASLNVVATGTSFNVMAYHADSTTDISLVTGNVNVLKASGNMELISALKPNQHLSFNIKNGNVNLTDDSDIERFTAWKDGKLIFRNEPLSAVVKKISNLYNVEIEIRGEELKQYRYRATFQEESLGEILKLLKLSSPIDYKEITRNPLPDGTFPERKIIIIQERNRQ